MIGTSGWFSSTTRCRRRGCQRGQQVLDGLDVAPPCGQPGLLDAAEMRDRRRNLEPAKVGARNRMP